MKIRTIGMIKISILLSSNVYAVESSIGVGAGFMYSGLGINLSIHDESSLYYAGIGCPAAGGGTGGFQLACGAGLGGTYILQNTSSKRHAVGLYAGAISGFFTNLSNDSVITRTRYGLAATYTYFFNNPNGIGFNIGFTPLAYVYNRSKWSWTEMLNIGYQFKI